MCYLQIFSKTGKKTNCYKKPKKAKIFKKNLLKGEISRKNMKLLSLLGAGKSPSVALFFIWLRRFLIWRFRIRLSLTPEI